MTAPETTPYAPPQVPVDSVGGAGHAYAKERRPVLLCIALTIVTAGFYPAIWLLRRRSFLNALDSSAKLDAVGPILNLLANVLAFTLGFADGNVAVVGRLVSLAAAILGVVLAFRVVSILRSDFRRTGRVLDVSYGWAFLFGIVYLQYKINQGANTPARLPAAG